jgi:hypothetical protein
VADVLRGVLAPVVDQRAGVNRWLDDSWQLLLDSADVQLLLHVNLAARLEMVYVEAKGVSAAKQQRSVAQLLEAASSSSSSSSKKKRQGCRQQQQIAACSLQVPPFHVQLFEALGVPALELMGAGWTVKPSGAVDTSTAAQDAGAYDDELTLAVIGATVPSLLGLKSLKVDAPKS